MYSRRNSPLFLDGETLTRDLSEAQSLFQKVLLCLHQPFFLAVHQELLLSFAHNDVNNDCIET